MKKIWIMFIVLIGFNMSLFGMQITDQKNRVITFDKPYKRVISLYPAHAEVLSALGAKDQLIGVSYDEKLHGQYDGIEVFTYHDNAEKFIAAKPDLILIRPMIAKRFKGLIKILNDNGIQVVSLQPASFKELPSYWSKLGKLVGKETMAKNYIEDFNNSVRKIEDISSKIDSKEMQKVFFESRHKNFLTTVPGTIAYTIIEKIGAINIASDAQAIRKGSTVAPYKLEKILSKGKDIDIFISQKGVMNRITMEDIYKTPGFSAIKAIQEKRVYQIDEDIISRPTKRITLGMEYLGKIIYPKYFN